MEPLSDERRTKWQREMDWLLSPTNYMVELVPAKQNGANGRTLEVCFIFFYPERTITVCNQLVTHNFDYLWSR